MPVTYALERNGRVMVITFLDPLKIQEVVAFAKESLPLYTGMTATVHTIVDLTRLTHLPPTLMSEGYKLTKLAPQNSGYTIMVSSSSFVYTMANTFMKGYNRLLRTGNDKLPPVVRTLDEAWREIDALLAAGK